MNLKQVIADGAYTVFARMAQENKLKQIESVQYIKQLAASMEVNIEDWDIMQIFGTGRGNNIYVDRREINKRFMENANKADLKKVEETKQVDPAIARMQVELNNQLRNTILTRIQQFERDKQTHLRSANDRARDVNTYLSRAVEMEMSIRALRKQEIDFADQIRKIEEGGFWKYHSFNNRRLHFRTVAELWLREVDKENEVDIKINFGKFEAVLDVTAGHVQVNGLEGNTSIGGTIHPHVSGGSICWGQAHETAHRHITSFRYAELMQLLANLLSDYNPDNPYQPLYRFQVEQVTVLAIKLRNEGSNLEEIQKLLKENKIEDYDYQVFREQRDPKRRSY